MPPSDDIPSDFFRELVSQADYPMACTDTTHRIVWCNDAFERLLGFSSAELTQKTWPEITWQSDVGADLASIQAVMNGSIGSYRMDKDYVHKRGHRVPVELIVRRFPAAMHMAVLFFCVEAAPARATRPELHQVQQEILKMIADLRHRIDDSERCVRIINHNKAEATGMGDKWQDGDKVGRDKITNSTTAFYVLGVCIMFLTLAVIYIVYYISLSPASARTHAPEPPPSLKGITD